LIATISILVLAPSVKAQTSFPNLESCGFDFWSNVKAAQELSLNVPLSKVDSPNKTVLAEIIRKEGLAHALMTVHVVYASCVEKAGIDIRLAAPAGLESYRRCAYQSAMCYAILIKIEKGTPMERQKASLPVSQHDVVDVLYRQSQKSFLNAVVFSAEGGKECVARARQETR
jgi:hypothetical protein